MWRAALPPCCEACEAFRRTEGQCALMVSPSPDNRRRLLTMPCDVQRLLERRFRRQGEDVARDAIVKWLDPGWAPDDIVRSYGRAPRDARLWLTSWPYLYLGRTSVRRQQRDHGDLVGLEEAIGKEPRLPPDPTLPMRVVDALDQVRRIDAVSYSMLLDLVRDAFDARAWRELLGLSEASVTDRKYLAVYRYLVCFHGVLDAQPPSDGAALALKARRFTAGEPSDQAALEATRAALHDGALTMSAWRGLYREGALRSLEVLGGPEALGEESLASLGTAFRRVLKLD